MATNPRIKPIEQATKRSWEDWMKFMDKIGAKDLSHKEIAVKVYYQLENKLENWGWWTQSVTTAYEQYIGRRIPGQRPDGTFQTSVSKATKLSMKDLMDKWVEFAKTDKYIKSLKVGDIKVGGTENRLSWRTKAADGTVINILSEPKANGTASIVVQHMGHQTLELNDEAKANWTEVLKRFIQVIN